jgi:hypothetical protein
MRNVANYALLFLLTLAPAAAQPVTFNFATPVQTVNTQTDTPGFWYIDRFAPHGFVSPVVAPNGAVNSLEESIAGGDVQAGTNFYNTQGRKFDIPPTSTSVTIALYVPAEWATENARKAGFWATVLPNTGSGDFPILEFQGAITSQPTNGPGYYPNGGIPGFYGWNNVTGTFDFIGLPAGFSYNTFVQLTITFIPPNGGFIYTVGDPSHGGVSIPSPQSVPNDTGIGNVILEGYNYGSDYNIFWNGAVSGAADAYQTGYAANLNAGDSVVDISNNGASGGNICVNVYAFDPSEELLACCSCLVTPDGLDSLSIQGILSGNTLTGEHPSAGVIELVASSTPAGAPPVTASDCNASGGGSLLPGLGAWGTTLHALSSTGGFSLTERPFTISSLSPGEYAHLTSFCGFIQSESGAGICPGCTAGALGAASSR